MKYSSFQNLHKIQSVVAIIKVAQYASTLRYLTVTLSEAKGLLRMVSRC